MKHSTTIPAIQKDPLWKKIESDEQFFLSRLIMDYHLTFQQARQMLIIAVDIQLGQLTKLSRQLPPLPDKAIKTSRKEIVSAAQTIWQEICSRPIDYHDFQPKTNKKRLKPIKMERPGKMLGLCPVASSATRCCGLLTLDAVTGCALGCGYCSVAEFSSRHQPTIAESLYERLMKLKLPSDETTHIGTGQSSDSLAWENRHNLLNDLFAFARKRKNVILELKSKSDRCQQALACRPPVNTIFTWSLNIPELIMNEEDSSAPLNGRITAARIVARRGYLVGFHFHPVVWAADWHRGYYNIVKKLLAYFDPEQVAMVSFGALTFSKNSLKSFRRRATASKLFQNSFCDNPGGKLTISRSLRIELFRTIYSYFKPWHNKTFFYLCMEENSLWEPSLGYGFNSNKHFEQCMKSSYRQKIDRLR